MLIVIDKFAIIHAIFFKRYCFQKVMFYTTSSHKFLSTYCITEISSISINLNSSLFLLVHVMFYGENITYDQYEDWYSYKSLRYNNYSI